MNPLRSALEKALERMDRARNILTDGNPRRECNWGMLDTTEFRAALALPTEEAEKELFIQCKKRDGVWIVTCAAQPGLILTHESLDTCLQDFVPAMKKLGEISAKLRANKSSAG